MALIKCGECGKEYSDKADRCPNCGCPNEKFAPVGSKKPPTKYELLLTLTSIVCVIGYIVGATLRNPVGFLFALILLIVSNSIYKKYVKLGCKTGGVNSIRIFAALLVCGLVVILV